MNKKELPKYIGPTIFSGDQKMTKEEVKNRFDNETAQLYSQKKPSWLPEFDFAFNLIAETLKPYMKPKSKILDLGAGTGNLSRKILETYNTAHITLVDFSSNMLSEVPTVLSEFPGQYTTITADIFDMDIETETYHNVMSSFAIHHARGLHTYRALYEKIYTAITPPGMFICADVIEGANPDLSSLNEHGWIEFLKEQDFAEKDINHILSNYKREDSPISIFEHLSLLKEVGFTNVDFLWKKYNFGIYVGIKT